MLHFITREQTFHSIHALFLLLLLLYSKTVQSRVLKRYSTCIIVTLVSLNVCHSFLINYIRFLSTIVIGFSQHLASQPAIFVCCLNKLDGISSTRDFRRMWLAVCSRQFRTGAILGRARTTFYEKHKPVKHPNRQDPDYFENQAAALPLGLFFSL